MFPIKNAVVQYTNYIIIHSVIELFKAHPYQSPLNISRDNNPEVYLNPSEEQILLLGYPLLFSFTYSFISVCQIGRLESSRLIPMLKQCQLEPVAHHHGCQIFNSSTNGDSRASLGSLCRCLATLTSKEVLSCVHKDFPVFHCAHCHLTYCWALLEGLSHSFFPCIKYLLNDRIIWLGRDL